MAHICEAKGGANVGLMSGAPGFRAANPDRSGALGCPIQAKPGWGISFSLASAQTAPPYQNRVGWATRHLSVLITY